MSVAVATPLIGMPPDFDCTEPQPRGPVKRVAKWFAARGLRVTDVEYDGDCALHSVAPAFVKWMGGRRATTANEVRGAGRGRGSRSLPADSGAAPHRVASCPAV